MRMLLIGRPARFLNIAFITAAILASILAGISYIAYESVFSPLLVAGVILGIFLALIWLRRPALAMYTALLVVFLPIGLFPANIHSALNRSLTVVALVAWVVLILVRRKKIIWTNTALIMLGFIIWSLLTVAWAQDLEIAKNIIGGYSLRFILFLFLIANEINSRETLDGLMYTLAIIGWVFVLAGIITLLFQGYEFGTRLQVLEENENTIGILFPVVTIGVIWLSTRSPNRRRALWTILSIVFLFSSFVLIALSGSRGGAITWFITIFFLLFWRQTRFWGVIGLLILIGAILIAPLILSTTVDRFLDRTGDTLLGGREALWQAAWLLVRDRPLTGFGIGNAPDTMMTYVRLFRSVGGRDRAVIHNPILTVWVETGLPGVLLYLGVLISAIWSFVRQYVHFRKIGVQRLMPYFALTTAAFLGYFVSWIKGGGLELSFSYFLMLALLLIPSHLDIHELTS